jgi:hypothetical protein
VAGGRATRRRAAADSAVVDVTVTVAHRKACHARVPELHALRAGALLSGT